MAELRQQYPEATRRELRQIRRVYLKNKRTLESRAADRIRRERGDYRALDTKYPEGMQI